MSVTLTQDGLDLVFDVTGFVPVQYEDNTVMALYYSDSTFDESGLPSTFFNTGPIDTATLSQGTIDTQGVALYGKYVLIVLSDVVQSYYSNLIQYTGPTTTTTTAPPTAPPSTITQADVSGLVLAAGKYMLSENVTVTQPFSADPGTIFDGAGYTITVDAADWPGLFSAPVTVMNLTVSGTPTVADNAGLFFATNTSGIACNCTNTCPISGGGGGIFGTSNGLAFSCNNTGSISLSGGGIFGSYSSGTAVGCTNSGEFGNSGGIFGAASSGAAINCSNSGTSNVNSSGGIFGSSSTGTATNCFNSAVINPLAGGIFGAASSGTARNCYNSGSFDYVVALAGGIFGRNSSGSVVNCFNLTGTDISGFGAFDANANGAVLDISNSGFGSGTWDSANQYLTGVSGEVWVTATPYTLSPFRTSVEGLLALFVAKPNAVVSLPRSMGIPDSEIAFATALDAKNDSSKYGALSQLTAFMFTYTPTNAAILYQDRNLDLSGNLNIIVPSDGNSGVSIGVSIGIPR